MHIIPSPCPNHIFNALMWKICTQEPRRSFSSPLTVLQVRIFRVLSSRFFILRWYAEIGSRILSSRNCSGQDESLKRELVWFRQCHFLATHFSNIPVRFSLRNRHAQTWSLQIMLPNFRLWFLACSRWNYRDSWKAALQLLLASVQNIWKVSTIIETHCDLEMLLYAVCLYHLLTIHSHGVSHGCLYHWVLIP